LRFRKNRIFLQKGLDRDHKGLDKDEVICPSGIGGGAA
jgi:hypothetical protein